MKTIPVIHRMITKRLSISRPNVETTWYGSPAALGSHQSGANGGIDERAHAEERGQGEQQLQNAPDNARKRSLSTSSRSGCERIGHASVRSRSARVSSA